MLKVTAALIKRDDKYLIARKRVGNLAGMWEFPGGKLEEGESLEECLKREIYEELGIEVQVDKYLTTSEYSYPDFSIELIGYLADYVSGEIKLTDHDRIEWVGPEEMVNYSFAPADLPLIEALNSED